jgi:two-component system, response regulator PdtaR
VDEAVPSLPDKQEVKPTILIVEDRFVTRWSAAEYLRMRGYRVLEAVNVTEALGLAATGATIDAVFSDVQLGEEQTGHDLAHWFSKHRPSIPLLLTSGANDPGPSPMSELRSFVRKPYDLTEVELWLRSKIERSGGSGEGDLQ